VRKTTRADIVNPARQDEPIIHYRREPKPFAIGTSVDYAQVDRVVDVVTATKVVGREVRAKYRPGPQPKTRVLAFGGNRESCFAPADENGVIQARGAQFAAERENVVNERHAQQYRAALEDEHAQTWSLDSNSNQRDMARKPAEVQERKQAAPASTYSRPVSLDGPVKYEILHTVQDPVQPITRKQVPNSLIVRVPSGVRNRNAVVIGRANVDGQIVRLVRKETPAEAIARAIHMVHDEIVLNGQGTLNMTGRKR
jgi:hypothetical protein